MLRLLLFLKCLFPNLHSGLRVQLKNQEDQIKKEQEFIKLKEWEENFDKEQKLKIEKEKLRDEKIKRRELEELKLKNQKEFELKDELTSRLENFEIKQFRKN